MANRERVEEEFSVPAHAVPVLVGKGAQVVNKIRSDTGAYVHVSEKNGKGLVVVRGNAEQVQRAVAEVKTRVQEHEQFRSGPKGKKGQTEDEKPEDAEEDAPPIEEAIFPCILRVVKEVESGRLKVGTPLVAPSQKLEVIGTVSSIENGAVNEVDAGDSTVQVVCIASPLSLKISEKDELLSQITRESLNALKVHYLDYVKKKENFVLLKRLKSVFNVL